MNKRKIENWLIFCLKMLPFLFLIIFAVYVHRHDLPDSVSVGDEQSYQEVYYNFVPDGNDIIVEQDNSKLDSFMFEYSYIFSNNSYETVAGISGERDLIYLGTATALNIQTNYTCEIYLDLGTFIFVYKEGNMPFDTMPPQFLGGGMYIDEFLSESDYLELSIMFDCDGSISDIEFSFGDAITDYSIVKVYNDYIVYDEPLEIIFYQFNNYLNNFYNFNIFNITDFYNWTVNTWFNGVEPLIYKSVFSILVYELIIDLLILMYSFITFIIKFAQKWLNGIYNKDW